MKMPATLLDYLYTTGSGPCAPTAQRKSRPVCKPVFLNSVGEVSLASSEIDANTERVWASERAFEGPAMLQGSLLHEPIASELVSDASHWAECAWQEKMGWHGERS